MSHLVQTMAYREEQVPWHRLGNSLPANQPLEVWLTAAGMDWAIQEAPVLYSAAGGEGAVIKANADAKVLYRSDTQEALSVVSNRYKVVQPREVMEFYRDLVSSAGFALETAGVLKGGRKLWALAKTGQETVLKGGDRVKAYLLLATSCDGTLATTAQFTSVRVVCNNTLQLAVNHRGSVVKVPHSTVFDPKLVKAALGLGLSTWDGFITSIKRMAERPLNSIEAMNVLISTLGDPALPLIQQPNRRVLQQIHTLFAGAGIGAELASASGTAWGLLNAVTQYVDHARRARSQDYRLDSAWFGAGAEMKAKAYTQVLKVVG
ncbi:DUF932 domain-containing protein [Chitinimonas sp. JJ19]|uniref:DUF932 domain-containing protein n=1 Tax=Chitinimonas sp. JJ19 TaxID=3109352 RepID=UPI003001E5D7